MTFWYHMKGTNVGTLNIYMEGQNIGKSQIWRRSGQQGNDWIKGEVDVLDTNGRKVSSSLLTKAFLTQE